MPAYPKILRFFPLFAVLALPLSLSAAVTLPDIVVTSSGSVLDLNEGYFRSGVDTSIGLGSVATSTFVGGPVAQGEQVSVIVRGAGGALFSMQPQAGGELFFRFDFQGVANPLFDDANVFGTFLDVEGGTIGGFQSGFLRSMPDRIYAQGVTGLPNAPITFSGIRFTWNQPQDGVTFDPMTLTSFALFVERPSDDPPVYFTMTPEPSRFLLLGLAFVTSAFRRRR